MLFSVKRVGKEMKDKSMGIVSRKKKNLGILTVRV